MTRELDEQLTKYLTDAHSLEQQALAQLRTAPDIAGTPALAAAFREHLGETEGHERAIRGLLESRGEGTSTIKDTVMQLGGKGFVLFARLQPDTPGKLLAHALSFEGLETASYELLRRVADRAGAEDVSEQATRICAEEREMIATLEGLVDDALEASLRSTELGELHELIPTYLADAHAIEEQAIGLLERAPKLIDNDQIDEVIAHHLNETREHEELVQARLTALGGDSSSVKDAAMRLGALNWSAFFQGHPDTPGKLVAFAYAFEHLEIGGYLLLRRLAERADDAETVRLADTILAQEREAASALQSVFDAAAAESLRAVGVRGS
ncbi:MAG TPA: DUF892 family protein [Gaiellaceae bacterium]|nr:DUF892 family protein [Gaiellaceae bacterium]